MLDQAEDWDLAKDRWFAEDGRLAALTLALISYAFRSPDPSRDARGS
jgi:hypothetical protein